jgi:hypothetical protein
VTPPERFWKNRIRWRLTGALQWPAFVLFTVLDGLVIDWLPPIASATADSDLSFFAGVLIATFGNLFLVGAAAPFLTRRLAIRRSVTVTGEPPELTQAAQAALQDRVATALLAVGFAATLVAGLANRPVIVSDTEATEAAGRAVLEYVRASDSDELKRNVETANLKRLGDDYFRICIARDDRERFFCFLVETDRDPPKVDRDPSAEPNSVYRGS